MSKPIRLTPKAREHWELQERDRAKHGDRGCVCALCELLLEHGVEEGSRNDG